MEYETLNLCDGWGKYLTRYFPEIVKRLTRMKKEKHFR